MIGNGSADNKYQGLEEEEALKSFQSIESSRMDAPNIIPKGDYIIMMMMSIPKGDYDDDDCQG